MLILFAFGAGVVVFAIFYHTLDLSVKKFQENAFSRQIKPDLNNRKTLTYIGAFAGLLLGIYFTAGTSYILLGTMLCAGLGAGAVRGAYYALDKRKEEIKRQECFLLFTTIELFLQSGLSIPQSLINARQFTPSLAEDINKTLAAWPTGVVNALEIFQDSLNLPEGKQLVSLLLQVSQSGSQNLSGILQAESKQMNEKQVAAEKARITRKPLFIVGFRFVPLILLLGLVGGVMITRVFAQLQTVM
jgi:hypothetical protein